MDIIIEFITEKDRLEMNYAAANYFLKGKNPISLNTIQELTNYLKLLNTDNEPITLTIISHTCETGLCRESLENFITWKDFYLLVNRCRTKFPFKLNLLAPCDSYRIISCIDEHNQIDEIWYSNIKNPTIKYAIILAYNHRGNFEIFKEWFKTEIGDEFPYGQYKKSKAE